MGFQKEITSPAHRAGPVPGLTYVSDYISAEKADNLIETIDRNSWSTELKRRVQHYGFRYDYRSRQIGLSDKLGLLPTWLLEMGTVLVDHGIFNSPPDQVIINEYLPGQGIAAHIDCIPCFDETIASLSLGSSCEMVFSGPNGQHHSEILEPTSLLCLKGPARFTYKHAIPARKSDVINDLRTPRQRRLSLTFRTVNLG